jgi:hypothetical protein
MRIRAFVMACGIVAGAFAAIAMPVYACEFGGNRPHTIDPQAQATDALPPSAPIVTIPSIRRGKGPEHHGCSRTVSSCDDLGLITLQVSATDDQTETASLGYRIELVSGSLPSDLLLPETAVRPATSEGLLLYWMDGNTDEQEALDFTLSIRAVDLAGNAGPPTAVAVLDPGSGGCSVARHGPNDSPGTVAAVLFVIAGLLRRGRRRGAASSSARR